MSYEASRELAGHPLTAREREVVGLLVREGLMNKEIAARLGVSLQTVKNYLRHIMLKLDCRSRTEVAVTWVKELTDGAGT